MQHKIGVASRANVLIHQVPVEVFQLLCSKVHPRNLVRVMVWRMEPIAVVDVDRRIRMTRSVASDFDLRVCQSDFMEDSSDREQILFERLESHRCDDWWLCLNRPATAWRESRLLLQFGKHDKLEALSQPLRNKLFEHFFGGQRFPLNCAIPHEVGIDIIRQQRVNRQHVIVVERSLIRKIIRRYGQTRWNCQRLPIDTCSHPEKMLIFRRRKFS